MKTGIYFGMDEDLYHSVPALGSTSIKQLLLNPVAWWQQTPQGQKVMTDLGLIDQADEDADESAAKIFGRAAHTVILEPHLFDNLYIERRALPSDYLTTSASIRDALSDHPTAYQPPRSAQRADLVAAAKRAGLKVSDDWETDFVIEAAGRTVLSSKWMARLRLMDRLMDMPRADLDGKSIRHNTMRDGASEVSVFWEEEGIPMKARFDRLRRQGIVDLKTYGAPNDANPIEFFLSSVARYGYDIQRAHYGNAWERMRAMVQAGQVYDASDAEMALLSSIKEGQSMGWRWLAVKTTGMPEVDRIDFTADTILESAQIQRRQAVETYRRYYEQFGMDTPWVSTRGRIVADDDTFRATRLEGRMTARGEETWNTQ